MDNETTATPDNSTFATDLAKIVILNAAATVGVLGTTFVVGKALEKISDRRLIKKHQKSTTTED